MAEWKRGESLAEGKTKQVFAVDGSPKLAILVSKDDVTAGDGARHDVLPGKGAAANQTTCNVFRLLEACGVPVAFGEQVDRTSFLAKICRMIPLEVVVRRARYGSYLQRHPYTQKGTVLQKLVVEFFLKTTGRKWRDEYDLICDDPLLEITPECVGSEVLLYDPHKPYHGQKPFLTLPFGKVFDFKNVDEVLGEIAKIARMTFLVLEKAWQILYGQMVDFKIEFGVPPEAWTDTIAPAAILLADVVDNDSWRVLAGGKHIDKQYYRESAAGDGGALAEMLRHYEHVGQLTDRFGLPQQRVVIWRGSEKDNLAAFYKALEGVKDLPGSPEIREVSCSGHKQTIQAVQELDQLVQEVPDTVIIAFVGRSNGLGPILSASSTAPVITVPATAGDFPEDAWSSLHMPSDTPLMTVLEPGNAVLAALNILSSHNPALYAYLRLRVEDRRQNFLTF